MNLASSNLASPLLEFELDSSSQETTDNKTSSPSPPASLLIKKECSSDSNTDPVDDIAMLSEDDLGVIDQSKRKDNTAADEVPSWLGQEGHENETVKWFSERESQQSDGVALVTSSTQAIPTTDLDRTKYSERRSFKPGSGSCTCGEVCQIPLLPKPVARDIEHLTPAEAFYRLEKFRIKRYLDDAASNTVNNLDSYTAIARTEHRMDPEIFAYAQQIMALAKGKNLAKWKDGKITFDEETFGDCEYGDDPVSPADRLLDGLKWYYLFIFKSLKKGMGIEFAEEVLDAVRTLIELNCEIRNMMLEDVSLDTGDIVMVGEDAAEGIEGNVMVDEDHMDTISPD